MKDIVIKVNFGPKADEYGGVGLQMQLETELEAVVRKVVGDRTVLTERVPIHDGASVRYITVATD